MMHPEPIPPSSPVCGGGDPATRALGIVTLVGITVFAVVCAAAQFLRTDYNPLGMPLSFYVLGPYGGMVEAGFLVLAPGLAALGAGWYRALDRGARSVAPLLLFVVAGIALCVTAIEYTDVPNSPPTLHGYLHVVASATTFLCVTVAMLLQAWRMRLDAHHRRHFQSAFALAAVAFLALWGYVLAISVAHIPRGLGEKVVIALILAWLWRAAWWLLHDPTADHAVPA